MTKKITLDWEVYIKKSEVNTPAEDFEGMKYVIVRTYSAGVFAGYLKSQEGKEVVLVNARRLWRWSGAASLSQMAVDGTSDPSNCKFPCEVPSLKLLEAIEILGVSEKAKTSINSVPVWTA